MLKNTGTSANEIDIGDIGTASSGIHFWDVADDLVYSDSSASELFGFTEIQGMTGLPLMSYVDRIHPEDRPRIAKAIHDAMLSGKAYHEEYRVVQPNSLVVGVVAIGRWFRNASGEPNHYSGILFLQNSALTTTRSVQQLILMAYDLAKPEGCVATMARLLETLSCLDHERANIAKTKLKH